MSLKKVLYKYNVYFQNKQLAVTDHHCGLKEDILKGNINFYV